MKWLRLAILTLPVLLIAMDSTVLAFAVPHLSEDLGPTGSQLLWIVDIYSFVLAGLLVTMGVVGDRIGRRRLLMLGAAAFSLASILAAFSQSPEMLIAARALLGLAGATLMPSTLSLIRNIFEDDRERQTAIAVWALMFAVGGAIGPLVGGLLLEHYWWGSVFLIGLPITVALLIVGPILLPESRDPTPGRFDVASSALSIAAMLSLVYGLKRTAEHGPGILAAVAVVAGLAVGWLFVRRQGQLTQAMIDVSLFRVPTFRAAIAGNFIACFGFAGALFFATQYLQLVVGMSPLRAGIQLLPAVGAAIVLTMAAPAAVRIVGPFAVVAVGLSLGAVGFGLMAGVDVSGSLALMTVALALGMGGLSAAITVTVDAILAVIPPTKAGAGASISETANELGMAMGTAVLGSVLLSVYRGALDGVVGIPEAALAPARDTLAAAHMAAADIGGPMGQQLRVAADAAFTDGVRAAALMGAAITAVVVVWVCRHLRSGRPGSTAAEVTPAEG